MLQYSLQVQAPIIGENLAGESLVKRLGGFQDDRPTLGVPKLWKRSLAHISQPARLTTFGSPPKIGQATRMAEVE